jgi:signal peptidase II
MKIFYLTFFIVITDQITKLLVKGINIPALGINIKGMQLYDSFNVIGDFFRITYIENPGMAFGIDFGESSKLFLTFFSLVASIAITYYLIKHKDEKLTLRIPLAMILGGAVGNLIDRMFYGVIYGEAPLFYGKVVDFLDFDFFNISLFGYTYDRWPIFNIADLAVSIGVILLIFLHRENREEEKSSEQEIETQSEDSSSEKVLENDAVETLSSNDEVRSE